MTVNLFISSDALECDKRLFLQPEVNEPVYTFDKAKFTFCDMAVVANLFPSRTLARKNGWERRVNTIKIR